METPTTEQLDGLINREGLLVSNTYVSIMLRRRSVGERHAGCVFVVAVKRHMKGPSASDVLRPVCAWADGMNEPLRLHPLAVQGGLDQQQLVAWYQRHGFTRDGSGTGMVRYPNAALSL